MLHRAAALASLAVAPALMAQSPRLIVGDLDQIPTATGPASLQSFFGSSYASMLPDGSVTFAASLEGSGSLREGYWHVDATGIHPVAVGGEPAAGVPNATYRSDGFTSVGRVGPGGLIAYRCELLYEGSSEPAAGIWLANPQDPARIVVTGDPVPAIPGASYYGFAVPRVDTGDRVSVTASMEGPGITSDNDTAFFQFSSGTSRVVAREGAPVPGAPSGVVFSSFRAQGGQAAADAAGRAAFSAVLRGPGLSSDEFSAWRETTAGLEQVYWSNVTTAPGYSDGTVFTGIGPQFSTDAQSAIMLSRVGGPTITTQNDTGVWYWDGAFHEVLREGSPINTAHPSSRLAGDINPGGSISFIANSGRMLVSGNTVDQSNITRYSLLRGDTSGFDVLLDLGGAAPQMPAGVTIESFFGISMNQNGTVALSATLAGAGVTPANDLVLYALSPDGAYQLIAREGQFCEFMPGFSAHISQLPGSTGFNFSAILNDSDQLLFPLSFNNGFTGLYTITVPSPASSALLLGAVLGVRRRQRRT